VAKVAQSATATWPKHAKSAMKWGHGAFSNKKYFTGM